MAREGRGYIEGVELVALMLSELATNAVQHAGTEFEVDITMTREASLYCLRVGVTDQSPGLPVLPEPAADAPHGRGLRIVESLADAWGIEIRRGHPGKTVWFVARLVANAPSGEVVDRIDRKEPAAGGRMEHGDGRPAGRRDRLRRQRHGSGRAQHRRHHAVGPAVRCGGWRDLTERVVVTAS
jgi:hypothetical protein